MIPARSGSKGLARKNIRDCGGKPLIVWTIEAALKATCIDDCLVTTDCLETAEIARSHGAWVPFLRDSSLARDDSSMKDVVSDVIERVKELGGQYDLIVQLQPTSPLRTHRHVDEAVKYHLRMRVSRDDTLFSARPIEKKVLWTFGIDEGTNYAYNFAGVDLDNPRRQDLPECFLPNGAIYIASFAGFKGFYSGQSRIFAMDKQSSIDIDELEDLVEADRYLVGDFNGSM